MPAPERKQLSDDAGVDAGADDAADSDIAAAGASAAVGTSRSRAAATMLPTPDSTMGTPSSRGSASSARAGNARQKMPTMGSSSMKATATWMLGLLAFTSL